MTMYNGRSFVEGGGLISYGTNFADNYRLVGNYAGKVLKGAIVLKKSLFGDARFIGALRSGIQKIAWGTSRFSA